MKRETFECPITHTRGKKVDNATVKSMVSVSLKHVVDIQHYFCPDDSCDVVYFSESGEQIFTTDDVREQVYQKNADNPDVMICYCFRHTTGDIQEKLQTGDSTSIIASITEGIQNGQCACDWRNPQGDCCLGNVRQLIKQLQEG